jgi:hypothetical protein
MAPARRAGHRSSDPGRPASAVSSAPASAVALPSRPWHPQRAPRRAASPCRPGPGESGCADAGSFAGQLTRAALFWPAPLCSPTSSSPSEPGASPRGGCWMSPARFLPRQPYHQGDEDVVDRRPSGSVRIGPPPAHEALMPAQHPVRGDQAMATSCSGQPRDEGGEDRSVRTAHAWSRVGAAEYRHFVPQHEEFNVLGGGRATQQQDQPEHLAEDQIPQPQRQWRGGDRARAAERAEHRWSRACATIWHPTRSG